MSIEIDATHEGFQAELVDVDHAVMHGQGAVCIFNLDATSLLGPEVLQRHAHRGASVIEVVHGKIHITHLDIAGIKAFHCLVARGGIECMAARELQCVARHRPWSCIGSRCWGGLQGPGLRNSSCSCNFLSGCEIAGV